VQGQRLAALIVGGLFAGFVLAVVDPSGNLLLSFLQSNGQVEHGDLWQLFTSIIVAPPIAGGLEDVAFNAVAVIAIDSFLSAVYTPKEYYLTFLATAVFGNLVSLLAGPAQVSFGASGGIFGLFAGVVTFDYAGQRQLSYQLVIIFAVIFALSSFVVPDVDWWAHAGGAILGLVLGYWIGSRRPPESY